MKTIADVSVLDLRNTAVPFTFLMLSHILREVKSGETLEVLIDDEDTKRDFFKVFPPHAYELIQMSDEGCFCRIRLKRAERITD